MKAALCLIGVGLCLIMIFSGIRLVSLQRTEAEIEQFGSTGEREAYAHSHGSDHAKSTRRLKESGIVQGRGAQGSLQDDLAAAKDGEHTRQTAPLKEIAIIDNSAQKTSAQEKRAIFAKDEAILTNAAQKEAILGNAAEKTSREEKNARTAK